MSNSTDAIREAELILKLYELRREPVMRQARSYIGGEFAPQSVDEFVGLVVDGGQHASYILQVYRVLGYACRIRGSRRAARRLGLRHVPGDVLPIREDPALSGGFPREDESSGVPAEY